MKICYLADAESIHTQRWVQYFADQGHQVHLISKNPCAQLKGIKQHHLKRLNESEAFSAVNLLVILPQVKSIIKKVAPDILHSHFVLDYGSYGAMSGFHPFVISAWGSDVLEVPKRSKSLRALTRYALNGADLITCDGDNSKEAMIHLGIPDGKIKIISHGIDTNRFYPGTRNENIRVELGLSGHPSAISIRHLRPVYDVGSFIRSMPLVLKEIPDAKFIIVGDGSDKEFLIKLAGSLGILNSVIFTGVINHEELPSYIASSDVYVSTSISDGGIAVSTLEAMASGLAPVVTDVGDNRKWIKDGENGFVVPIGDSKMLAERIIYLLQNKDVLRRFGAANRSIVEERADYYKEMEKMGRIYEDLVGGNQNEDNSYWRRWIHRQSSLR
ncbi:MAG: glycosyltransferase [Methanotrichaceae archaeon]